MFFKFEELVLGQADEGPGGPGKGCYYYVQIYLGNKYDFYSTFFQKEFVSIKSTTQNSAAQRKTKQAAEKEPPPGAKNTDHRG